ncbi:MAG: endonuclease/exonuclease/phosphatase family protein [Candidatus Marinimicrobia bacterium]|jgi:predicted extracellular nuclease|nr:endonuclease/exonuclease/phosphatase family protein [Candidatus Neomarinimicrobiota bacterium]MBT3576238.1 endonuclease/exonuclease/phosphatase family protein [Candidatus Neomarinimicrobiota bacterium]MBT3680781.1 endonuclease/exonuclease/phosphatase family protein [Candidatus Neomarinimicrobiota bacterium]MBT3950770.1 endonuclease/exonuclease/phosphatase family protein [Candidatus Neomarinimicrobiota bacterium]MBT4252348.1 endonuclease/exonuclease/phosphatase family protein [Candidatus Neom
MRLLLLSLIVIIGSSGLSAQSQFKAAFWNIENLFDTTNAALIRDDDFTPSGKYLWTEERLVKKFQDVSRVIHELDQTNDLAILGLAEIENKLVLNRLNKDFIKAGMKMIHKESPDERGIDCALLYDSSLVTANSFQFLPIFLAGDEKTRDIVEAEFSFNHTNENQTLYVFVNHWPSRWGGQKETDPLRRTAARTLRTRIDQILLKNPQADILVMGDFNDYPDDPSLYDILRAHEAGPQAYPGDLINTTWSLDKDPDAGTCMYRGQWTVLDQIIISAGMRDKKNFDWAFESTKTFMPPYLIEKDGKYKGWPYRMYRSGKYHGGYSDHLPIVCNILVSPTR